MKVNTQVIFWLAKVRYMRMCPYEKKGKENDVRNPEEQRYKAHKMHGRGRQINSKGGTRKGKGMCKSVMQIKV